MKNHSRRKSLLCALVPLQGLVPVLVVDTLLSGTTSGIRTTLSHATQEVILTNAARVLSVPDLVVEASIVLGVAVETALLQVLALGLRVARQTGDVADVRGGLAAVVLAVVAAAAGVGAGAVGLVVETLATAGAQVLLCAGGTADVACLGHVGAGEVTLAVQGLRVLFLSVDVLTGGADRGGGEGGSAGGVGVVQGGLAAGDTEGFGTAVLREGTSVGGRFSGERVVDDGAGWFTDRLLVGLRVGGDLHC